MTVYWERWEDRSVMSQISKLYSVYLSASCADRCCTRLRTLIAFLMLVVVQFCLVAPSFADSLPSCKICVVDLREIIEQSKVGKAAQASVEGEVSKVRMDLKAKQKTLAERRSALEKESALLSAEAASKKRRELRDFERDLQDQFQEMQQRLVNKRGAASSRVLDSVKAALDLLAKRGYQGLVLENDPRLIVYANKALDVSSKVRAVMDEQYSP